MFMPFRKGSVSFFPSAVIWTESKFSTEAGGVPISITKVADKTSNMSQGFVFNFLKVSFYRKASTINVFKTYYTRKLKKYIFNQTILLIKK